MKKHLIIALGILVVFLGILLAMPPSPPMKPSRLATSLPEEIGLWFGKPREPGAQELEILAKDTMFERMEYYHLDNKEPIEVSIVFSGKNVSQSIHRPEVCLNAQGWTFVKETYRTIEGVLPNGESLPIKEMVCRRPYLRKISEKEVEPVLNEDGEPTYLWRVFFYTFFGHTEIHAGHYERTFADMEDRVMRGYAQRWAYATFSAFVSGKHVEQGLNFGSSEPLGEEETIEHLEDFMGELLPLVVSSPKDQSPEKDQDPSS